MRVSGPGRVGSVKKAGGNKSASKTGEKFSVPKDAAETIATSNVASASPIASIDAILALQGVDDSTSGNRKALSKGQDLLDRLEEIRHGLLIGAIPVERLKHLKETLASYDVRATDPKLAEIVEEIEVRAAVELAKLGF
ncbi:MAG: flagellar assembly protein FliX [Sneathiella sp.]|nr:flagellar assembly protein FliX [Sneathiella sp.]